MDRLWSPWRSEYIASAGDADAAVCVFCKLRDEPVLDTKIYSSEAGSGMASLGELADFGLSKSESEEEPK